MKLQALSQLNEQSKELICQLIIDMHTEMTQELITAMNQSTETLCVTGRNEFNFEERMKIASAVFRERSNEVQTTIQQLRKTEVLFASTRQQDQLSQESAAIFDSIIAADRTHGAGYHSKTKEQE